MILTRSFETKEALQFLQMSQDTSLRQACWLLLKNSELKLNLTVLCLSRLVNGCFLGMHILNNLNHENIFLNLRIGKGWKKKFHVDSCNLLSSSNFMVQPA